jgi:hypothetical protein
MSSFFNLPFGVRVAGAEPVDGDRYLGATAGFRDALITTERAFEGVQVYQEDTKTLYILETLVQGDPNNSVWAEIGGGSTFSGTITGATNGLSTFGASNDLIGLGGTLGADTTIFGDDNEFSILNVDTLTLGSTNINLVYDLPGATIGFTTEFLTRASNGDVETVTSLDIGSLLGATNGLTVYGAANNLFGLGGEVSTDTLVFGSTSGVGLTFSGYDDLGLQASSVIIESDGISFDASSIELTQPLAGVTAGATTQVVVRDTDGILKSVDASDVVNIGTKYVETITSWTDNGDDTFYADVNHNLGTEDIIYIFKDTNTSEQVLVNKVQYTDDNTIRVFITDDTSSLRITVKK